MERLHLPVCNRAQESLSSTNAKCLFSMLALLQVQAVPQLQVAILTPASQTLTARPAMELPGNQT